MKLLTIKEKRELEEKILPIKSVVKGVFKREVSDFDGHYDEVCIMLINGISAIVKEGYCGLYYKGLKSTEGYSQEPILYTLEDLELFKENEIEEEILRAERKRPFLTDREKVILEGKLGSIKDYIKYIHTEIDDENGSPNVTVYVNIDGGIYDSNSKYRVDTESVDDAYHGLDSNYNYTPEELGLFK